MPRRTNHLGQRQFGTCRGQECARKGDNRTDGTVAQAKVDGLRKITTGRWGGGRPQVGDGHCKERNGKGPHRPAAMYVPKGRKKLDREGEDRAP